MFRLPQPPNSFTASVTSPVVDMVETSTVLGPLLQACYPARSEMDSPYALSKVNHDNTRVVLEAARKYDIAAVDGPASVRLLELMYYDTLAVYATAARFGLQQVADTAARQFLKSKLMQIPCSTSMNDMSAYQLYELLHYHHRCGEAARVAVSDCYESTDLDEDHNLDSIFTTEQLCECFRMRNEWAPLDHTMDTEFYALPAIWQFVQCTADALLLHPDPIVIVSPEEIQVRPSSNMPLCEGGIYGGCMALTTIDQLSNFYQFIMKRVTEAIAKVGSNFVHHTLLYLLTHFRTLS